MASLLIISSLIFNGYSTGMAGDDDFSSQLNAPIDKAENVNQLIVDATTRQQEAIAKQIQQ